MVAEPDDATDLAAELYDELRRLAHARMKGQTPGHTLQTTGLVHEAWLKLGGGRDSRFRDREHFFRAAAQAMRSVLIDHARRKRADKRGGGRQRVPLDDIAAAYEAQSLDLLTLESALVTLESTDEELAEIARLRFFAGLTVPDVAATLGLSVPTIERRWRTARAFLRAELGEPDDGEGT
ncbi:MAG: sigma-70 family RNA polymerase sigma factor [Planctomycetes bacterium]|nr:sigma-70 family RNA polymerase sigma factor [Planctomycetota bacterium]